MHGQLNMLKMPYFSNTWKTILDTYFLERINENVSLNF